MLPSLLKFELWQSGISIPQKTAFWPKVGSRKPFLFKNKNNPKTKQKPKTPTKTQKPQDLPFNPIFFLDKAKIMLRVVFIKLSDQL